MIFNRCQGGAHGARSRAHRLLFALGVAALFVDPATRAAVPGSVSCVNVAPGDLPALSASARAAGMTLNAAGSAANFSGPLVVWQATGSAGGDITPAQAAQLEAYVRQGGSLFLTLDRETGVGPFRLADMLPTTAWETQIENAHRGTAEGPIAGEGGDKDLIGDADPHGIQLSYYYRIRPLSAVERGEARYRVYARTLPYINLPVPPDNDFWTRPLIARDWRVRLWGNDVAHDPLLLTGRYGAGRIAVLAGGLSDLERSPAGKTVEAGALQWLTQNSVAETGASSIPATAPAIVPAVTVDAPTRALHVSLTNPTTQSLTVQVVARRMTWEPALIGDDTQTVVLPASGEKTVDVAISPLDATSYQALAAKDAYTFRVGVLSQDGAQLLGETRANADLRPPVTVSVATDNIDAIPSPYHAPGQELFSGRMGLPISAYAYKPGQTVQATVTVANGVRDLSPLSVVADETQPANPSLPALTDEAANAGKVPLDGIAAYGMWVGQAGQENVLRFTFPHPVMLSSITLLGASPSNARDVAHNPGGVVIEADGNTIAQASDLDARFADGYGRAAFEVTPVRATVVRVRLPWVADYPGPQRNRRREVPWLGEVALRGTDMPSLQTASGTVTLVLRDALSGSETMVGAQPIQVAPGRAQTAAFPVALPAKGNLRFLRLEARYDSASAPAARAAAPVLVIQPTRTLLPSSDSRPDGAVGLNFVVTHGFRNASDIGTGTQEVHSAWDTPDDLVWAYSRRFKQTGAGATTEADRLYVTDADFRHYSTPWDSYVNGEDFLPASLPHFIEHAQKSPDWNKTDTVAFGFGDRWDSGPSVATLYNWQDLIAFDEFLRSKKMPGLKGRTREALSREIDDHYPGPWQHWQLDRYISNIHTLRTGMEAAGKHFAYSGQGIPIVPISDQKDIGQILHGESDDSTWGMSQEDVPLTVGRQMSILAFDPDWRLSTLLQWGWNSAILENEHWHAAVGTTEPSHRHYYDRAWRGCIGMNGAYNSIHTFGFNSNGGFAYTMGANDWQQFWDTKESNGLIYPDAPLGVGLVLSSASMENPQTTFFSGGGMGADPVVDRVMEIANVVRRLHEAGISVPFTANAATLGRWKGNAPLLLLNPAEFSPAEVETLKTLAARGVHIAAFAGNAPLPAAVQALFAQPNTLLIPGAYTQFDAAQAGAIAPRLHAALDLPITYPEGTAGYGFVSQGKKFVEIEDWQELGRTVAVRLHAGADATGARACEINDHQTLAVHRDGADWVIDLPLRPGDGDVICVEETR